MLLQSRMETKAALNMYLFLAAYVLHQERKSILTDYIDETPWMPEIGNVLHVIPVSITLVAHWYMRTKENLPICDPES